MDIDAVKCPLARCENRLVGHRDGEFPVINDAFEAVL